MTECKLCGEVIKKNDEFILEGKFPGLSKRYLNFDFFDMEYYGNCYHKSCYIQKFKTGF